MKVDFKIHKESELTLQIDKLTGEQILAHLRKPYYFILTKKNSCEVLLKSSYFYNEEEAVNTAKLLLNSSIEIR